jgi:integrative and conjugative element protein (TIGR02256 family)
MTDFLEPDGELVEADGLAFPRARAFRAALADGTNDYARLIECRANSEAESIIFEVDVELSQIRRHPIQHRERLAAVFSRADQATPEVLALRKDFPSVPHLNLRLQEYPRSLCLYDEPFRDLKKTWTAPRFIERVREWLALTAAGLLHQEDQPLEPLFFAGNHIILPDDLFDESSDLAQRLQIEAIRYPSGKLVCLVEKVADKSKGSSKPKGGEKQEAPPEFVATAFRCAPQTHGVIRRQPATIEDLHEVLTGVGTDLLTELRARVKAWEPDDPALDPKDDPTLDAKVILIITFPKTREAGGLVEATDVWTFLTGCSLRELGKEIGLWDLTGQKRGQLLVTDQSRRGQAVEVDLLHSHFSLSRRRASLLNGRKKRFDKKIAAVGVGAIGSQVILNLVRSAFGEWTLIDDDILFPHNLARHALHGGAEGYPKAHALASFANSLLSGDPIAKHVLADVLEPGKSSDEVEDSLKGADIILDMSASVTVARHLALAPEYPGRRVSLFLSPTGDDFVLLAEDDARSVRLDSVEMQYYRALAFDPGLEGHFKPPDARRRYGQSCRDVTSDIPQDSVALHAANGSRALKVVASTAAARIIIWRADYDGNVRRVDIGPATTIRHTIGDWTVCTDSLLVHRLAELREAKLPKETGGVLVGSFDLERRIVYIVDTIPSPPDSEEWPTLYIRGCRGLKAKTDEIAVRTDGMLEYIGEWHSHPRGCPTRPSSDDIQVFAWLTNLMNVEGLPALMMIVGDGGNASCHIGQMSEENLQLPEVPL